MAHVLRQCTVTHDGMHNAFTDLVHWQGAYWVAYRKGAAHVSADSCCAVAVSYDRNRFMEVAHVRVAGDNRDPKLVVVNEHCLAMVFPSWLDGPGTLHPDKPRHLHQYVAFSDNGYDWDTPIAIRPDNRWLWRVRGHDGTFYGLDYGPPAGQAWEDKLHDLWLMRSDDLRQWQHVATIDDGTHGMGESDLVIRADGEMWVVSRSSPNKYANARFAVASPPYTDWQITELDVPIHAPAMLEHDGAVYAAGRRIIDAEGDALYYLNGGASMGVWRIDRGQATAVLHLPAGGDCSYPGLIHDPDGRVCMSYYSQHAYLMGVRPNVFEATTTPSGEYDFRNVSQSDIYFAELALP